MLATRKCLKVIEVLRITPGIDPNISQVWLNHGTFPSSYDDDTIFLQNYYVCHVMSVNVRQNTYVRH